MSRFRDRNRQETLGGEAVLKCFSWQQFESHQEVAKSWVLLRFSSCKRKQASISTQPGQGQAPPGREETQTHNPKPELLCSCLPDVLKS